MAFQFKTSHSGFAVTSFDFHAATRVWPHRAQTTRMTPAGQPSPRGSMGTLLRRPTGCGARFRGQLGAPAGAGWRSELSRTGVDLRCWGWRRTGVNHRSRNRGAPGGPAGAVRAAVSRPARSMVRVGNQRRRGNPRHGAAVLSGGRARRGWPTEPTNDQARLAGGRAVARAHGDSGLC